jgi:hypothetical protein
MYDCGVMEIHRAAEFGLLTQKLGIKPDVRVAYRLTNTGVVIWDLSSGHEYVVRHGDPNPSAGQFALPQNIKAIIEATDEALKKRLSESWMDGWSDERETIFTELIYRGISVLGL